MKWLLITLKVVGHKNVELKHNIVRQTGLDNVANEHNIIA